MQRCVSTAGESRVRKRFSIQDTGNNNNLSRKRYKSVLQCDICNDMIGTRSYFMHVDKCRSSGEQYGEQKFKNNKKEETRYSDFDDQDYVPYVGGDESLYTSSFIDDQEIYIDGISNNDNDDYRNNSNDDEDSADCIFSRTEAFVEKEKNKKDGPETLAKLLAFFQNGRPLSTDTSLPLTCKLPRLQLFGGATLLVPFLNTQADPVSAAKKRFVRALEIKITSQVIKVC
jgi:hypothetical protein